MATAAIKAFPHKRGQVGLLPTVLDSDLFQGRGRTSRDGVMCGRPGFGKGHIAGRGLLESGPVSGLNWVPVTCAIVGLDIKPKHETGVLFSRFPRLK